MRTFVFLCLLGVAFAAVAKKSRVVDQKLSDEEPGTKDFDHEAFLGEEQAKEFDDLPEEESIRRLGIIVDRLDSDHNEIITKEELEAWIKKAQNRYVEEDAERQMTGADTNKNGKMEWDEYYNTTYLHISEEDMKNDEENHGFSYKKMINRDERRWKAADVDGDNTLTQEEMQSFLHPEEYTHMKEIVLDETIQDIDKNADGYIDLDEYIGDMFSEDEGDEPEWVQTERNQFSEYRDKDKDNRLDREEVRAWILPEDYNSIEAEASHLIYEADTDKDESLTKEEILEHHDLFVGSQITNWGDDLKRHDEF